MLPYTKCSWMYVCVCKKVILISNSLPQKEASHHKVILEVLVSGTLSPSTAAGNTNHRPGIEPRELAQTPILLHKMHFPLVPGSETN